MLPLDGHTLLTTQLIRNGDSRIRVEIYSRASGGEFTRHATAMVEQAPAADARRYDEPTGSAGATTVSPGDFYALLRQTGQHHGPAFAALTRITRLPDGSSETEITVPDEVPRHPGYLLHPVVLDAALQSMAAAISDGEVAGSAESSYLPVSFEKIRVYRDIGVQGRRLRCRAYLTNLDGGAGKLGRIALIDDSGSIAAEVDGIYLRRVERRAVPLPLAQKIFDAEWAESPLTELPPDTTETEPASWLVLTDPTLDAPAKSLADEFVEHWRSPTRRVHTADLHDESAVLAAFAETAGDPEHPPAGLIVFVGGASTGLDDRTAGSARGGVVDHDRRPCRRRHVARPIAAVVVGQRGRTFRSRRRSGVPRDGRIERPGAGPRLRASGHALHFVGFGFRAGSGCHARSDHRAHR